MYFHLLFCGASLAITIFLKVTASAVRNSGSFSTKVTVPDKFRKVKTIKKTNPNPTNQPYLFV